MILDIIGNRYRLLICASDDRHGLTHRRHDGYDAGPLSGIVASAAAVVGSHGNDASFQGHSEDQPQPRLSLRELWVLRFLLGPILGRSIGMF